MLKKIISLLLLLPALVQAQTDIPDLLQVPEGYMRVLSLHAKGEQIYQCVKLENNYEWQFKAPNALLFDTSGQLAGSHFVGPEWKYKDGSHTKGKLLQKVDVTPESAIAWLLLETTEPQGNGILATARYIQRVNTQGGLPPKLSCNNNHLGIEKPALYSADYIFYAAK
jgi:hypothetical protein